MSGRVLLNLPAITRGLSMLTEMKLIMESHRSQCSAQLCLFNIRSVVEAGSIKINFLYADDTQLYLSMEPDQSDQVRVTKMSYN